MAKRAIFLDRDGTINEDPGYLSDPAHLKLIPGVEKALAELKAAGFLLVVVSNQSGVGRGLIRLPVLHEIHEKLNQVLAASHAEIDHFELCFHRPEDRCSCRKPKPQLILDAAAKLGIDVSRSFMVGDKVSDVEAGTNAGCTESILVRTGEGLASELRLKADGRRFTVVDSLAAAAELIIKLSRATR
jgi:D-glycero-D-manno-heptose 1,7-bisphosphate phosphatase